MVYTPKEGERKIKISLRAFFWVAYLKMMILGIKETHAACPTDNFKPKAQSYLHRLLTQISS